MATYNVIILSSEMLRTVNWLVTDISIPRIGLIFKENCPETSVANQPTLRKKSEDGEFG